MMRSARRLAALAGCLLFSLGGAASDDVRDPALPPGIRPFAGSISLRYGQFASFTYTWRSDIEAEGRPATILEGWVMQGEMRNAGDVATWSYRLANIGRDGLVRERGALRVRTDAWGGVRDAE